MSVEEFDTLKTNYVTDVAGEVIPQTSTHQNTTTDGTTVHTANKQVLNRRPDGHCSTCVAVLSKLDEIVSLLNALSVRVDTLDRKLSTLCEKNSDLHA